MNKDKKLKVFEAFSGVGSQHTALKNINANFEVVGISEIDKFAIKSYKAIHGDNIKNYGDISKIDINTLPSIDLFTYSFPCQDISQVGELKGINNNTRSGLLYECKKIIESKKPKFLLMENVKNLVGKRFKNQFDTWLEFLESLGYKNYWRVLNATDFNIPQNRERVIVVSILGDNNFKFPTPRKLELELKDLLEANVDEKYLLSDLIKESYIHRSFSNESKGNGFRFKPHVIENAKIGFCITTKAGQRMDDNYLIYDTGSNKDKFIFDTTNNELACVKCLNGSILINDISDCKIRRLTPLECWRLMGFSDVDFYKASAVNSNTQLYKQAGNSIVVNVLEDIFKELLKGF